MGTIEKVKIWPHMLSTVNAAVVAGALLVFQVVGLLIAAYLDHSLILSESGVGLFEHPGMFSVVIGDCILFVLASMCSKKFFEVGDRIPTSEPERLRRYFRSTILRTWFGERHGFLWLFLSLFFIGLFALTNQSIKLMDPITHYGHDTFDSYIHFYSFCFNRLNLFISWCVVLPLFSTYLLLYTVSINRIFRLAGKRELLRFLFRHEDHAGGFAFFGNLNVLYMLGLLIVFLEIILLIYTHKNLSVSNILSMTALSITFIIFSYFSVFEISKALRHLEQKLKNEDFKRFDGNQRKIDSYHLLLHYNAKFSLYTAFSEKTLLAMRFVVAIPTLYKLAQYSRIIF